MRPLLSIVTPVFNGERYLAACINNVAEQAFERAEHIIVDGGSTDRSVEIIQAHAARHPHIRWISEKDRGQFEAMNKGIAMAAGDYVSILNADDFYEPGVFRRAAELIGQAPAEARDSLFLLGNCRIVDDQERELSINRPRKMRRNWMLTGLSFRNFPSNPSAYFYHKSLHQAGGPYLREDRGHQDIGFILRALPVTTVIYRDEIWGNFRLYHGTITANTIESGVMAEHVLAVLRSIHPLLHWTERLWVVPGYLLARSRLYGAACKAFWWLRGRLLFTIFEPRRAMRRIIELMRQAFAGPLRRSRTS